MYQDKHLTPEDRLLLDAFEAGRLDAGSFDHRRHVHVAWAILRREPFAEALSRYRDGLLRLVERVGARDKYHETITCAMLTLVRERMERGGEDTWEEFAAANPDLLEWAGGGPLARYYERETLDSDLARTVFVLPDRGLSRPVEERT